MSTPTPNPSIRRPRSRRCLALIPVQFAGAAQLTAFGVWQAVAC